MSGRAATTSVIEGKSAISVGDPGTPVPPGWLRVPLLSVAELGTGHTPSRSRSDYWEGGIPWIAIPDARDHHTGVITTTTETVSQLGIENSAARILPAKTVGLSRTASVGYVFIMGRPMATSQDFVTWTCSDSLDPRFLMYALLAEGDDIRKFGKGSTHTTIYFPEVKAFHLNLAPKPEQHRIVTKLDNLRARSSRARQELDHIPNLIERYKQAILAKAFSGELTKDWRAKNPCDASVAETLEKVRCSRSGIPKLARRNACDEPPPSALPRTWLWVSPDELAADTDYSIGIGPFGSNLLKSDYREAGVRLVFVRDIRCASFSNDHAKFVSLEKAATLHQHVVRGGDLLITKMGDPPGDAAIYPSELPAAIITADCIKWTPLPILTSSPYLLRAVQSGLVQQQILEITKGVAHQKMSLDRFRTIAIPVAPIAEQNEIINRVEQAFAWLDKIATEHARAEHLLPKLDQAILTKAFRGELVPQDPNDEPASVLLERIKAERNGGTQPRRRVAIA